MVDSRLKLNVVPLRMKDDRCLGISKNNTGLLMLLNHGISILGDNYWISRSYEYTDGLITYTIADLIRDHIEKIFLAILILIAAMIFFGFRHYRKMAQEAEKEAEQKR